MDMILDALKVMLFGMLGIFVVMGIIMLSTKVLDFFGKAEEEPGETTDDSEE